MIKKILFLVLAILLLIKAFIILLITCSGMLGIEMPTSLEEMIVLSSNHTYVLIMQCFSIACGVILIFLSRKSNLWLMWMIGAIYSGSTWLLIYYGTTLHRFTENSKPSFPPILKVLVLSTAGWALITSFIPMSLSSVYFRSAAIIIQTLIIRATIASYCYRTLLKGNVLFCILYLIFGAVALLAGQTIAIIAANHKKNGI